VGEPEVASQLFICLTEGIKFGTWHHVILSGLELSLSISVRQTKNFELTVENIRNTKLQ
jgi:hypothetical protein